MVIRGLNVLPLRRNEFYQIPALSGKRLFAEFGTGARLGSLARGGSNQ